MIARLGHGSPHGCSALLYTSNTLKDGIWSHFVEKFQDVEEMIGFRIQITDKNTDPQISKVGLPIREKKTMVITALWSTVCSYIPSSALTLVVIWTIQ
jgi:hypothetical protein